LKISQHLAKLWTGVGCPGLFDSWGICTVNQRNCWHFTSTVVNLFVTRRH